MEMQSNGTKQNCFALPSFSREVGVWGQRFNWSGYLVKSALENSDAFVIPVYRQAGAYGNRQRARWRVVVL